MTTGVSLVRLAFPDTFETQELRGVTVDATCFAVREHDTHPLWCDFKHPVDGRWQSVFARREWATAAPTPPATARAPFKRPR